MGPSTGSSVAEQLGFQVLIQAVHGTPFLHKPLFFTIVQVSANMGGCSVLAGTLLKTWIVNNVSPTYYIDFCASKLVSPNSLIHCTPSHAKRTETELII